MKFTLTLMLLINLMILSFENANAGRKSGGGGGKRNGVPTNYRCDIFPSGMIFNDPNSSTGFSAISEPTCACSLCNMDTRLCKIDRPLRMAGWTFVLPQNPTTGANCTIVE
jgi:hypothetical protein